MISLTTGLTGVLGLAFVVLFALLLVVLRVVKEPRPGRDLRPLRAFTHLRHAVNLTVESGKRLHISVGRGEITHPRVASAFAGLSAAHKMVELSAASDRAAIVTAGTGPLGILARSTLHSAYHTAGHTGRYKAIYGQVSGLTPFSYAAGAAFTAGADDVAVNFLAGSFGPEVALIAENGERHQALTVGGSENIAAQAVLYAAAEESLIGEEVFASGAYLQAGGLHGTSLLTQDIFRWLLVVVILGGALAKLVGVLP